MRENEMIPREEQSGMQLLAGMADTLTVMAQRIERLEAAMAQAVPVTRGQAMAINAMIRIRAAELAATYRLASREKAIAAAIRTDLRKHEGVRSVQDIPRIDYEVALQRVELWDDYKVIRRLRE